LLATRSFSVGVEALRWHDGASAEGPFFRANELLALNGSLKENLVMAENADDALMLEILKEIRKEQRDQRTLLLQLSDANRRLERSVEGRFSAADKSFAAMESRFAAVDRGLAAINTRFAAVDQSLAAINSRAGAIEARIGMVDQRIGHLTDELELMVKSEFMGALTNFQNKIEIYVDQRLAEKAE
jgi:hypothetical protein